jgi:tetraacyldisaccharide 4'-kinase
MPAGPLREPIEFGLKRADAIIIIGEDKTGVVDIIRRHTQVPVLAASLVADAANPDIKGKKVFAFAGIGRPGKFRETLEEAGALIEGWAEFPDHYPYDDEDLLEIASAAEAQDAMLVTTAKDHVRLPSSLRKKAQKFTVHLVWQDPGAVIPLIEQALRKRTL